MKQTAYLVGFSAALLCLAPLAARAQCLGDFNGDGMVRINEIIISVNNALNGCQGSGQRFVDNGNGTITDATTGLMWEKKDHLNGTADFSDPHDADNLYQWSSTGTAPDGAAFADFLVRLNDCNSSNGKTVTVGFAGHCDWRLPTIAELQTIVDPTASGCTTGAPCIDPTFGPTQALFYWSETPYTGFPNDAWLVGFYTGGVTNVSKTYAYSVRAVRGGS